MIIRGKLEVICGSMFSGKSEELIKRMKRAIYAQESVQIFKHYLDNRNNTIFVSTHNGNKMEAISLTSSNEINNYIFNEINVIGIDEIQFFDYDIILVINELINRGKRVIVAGLDLDFKGIPFSVMPHLLALADEVTKLKAICMKTGKDAHFSQRLINGMPASYKDPILLVGAKEYYEARSRDAFEIDRIPLEEYINHIKKSNK